MRHVVGNQLNTCNLCTSIFLFFSFASLPVARTQDTSSVTSTLTTKAPVTMPSIENLDSVSTSVSSPVTPVFPNQPPFETYSGLFIATERTPSGTPVKNRVFNYYFLFLALLAAILAVLLWWLYRQKRREREQVRLRGQRALVRDVERWAMYRRRQPPIVEGLNESGEAPPPYQPKDDTLTTLEPVNDAMDGAVGVARPPRALSRHNTEHIRLPDYSETVQIDGRNVNHLSPTRPNETTAAHPRSS